jgi:excisionase family DNA binding protein
LKKLVDNKILLTSGDVAKYLGVHINTVRRWEQKGILKSYRVDPKGYRWFRKEDIEIFIKNISKNEVKTERSSKIRDILNKKLW